MRILLIHNILWSHYKAAVFSALSRACKDKSYSFKVIHLAETEGIRKRFGGIDIELHQYNYEVLHKGSHNDFKFFEKLAKLIKVVKKEKPDCLSIAGYYDFACLLAAYWAKFHGIKIVMMSDSAEADRARNVIWEKIKSLLIKPFDLFFCYGSKAREYLLKLRVKDDKIKIRFQSTQNEIIRNIYLKSKNKLRDHFSEKNFIYVGRLSPEKNIPVLLHAFAAVRKLNWGLVLVGDGPQRRELEDLVKKLALEQIYFTGPKSWHEVVTYYASADVFVLPSLSEPWGLVVNEAMLCDLPVIVSNRCGCAMDLVREGVNGFVFDPFDSRQLERLMRDFADDNYDLVQMGRRSNEIIQKFSPENSARQMLEGIEMLLRDAK